MHPVPDSTLLLWDAGVRVSSVIMLLPCQYPLRASTSPTAYDALIHVPPMIPFAHHQVTNMLLSALRLSFLWSNCVTRHHLSQRPLHCLPWKACPSRTLWKRYSALAGAPLTITTTLTFSTLSDLLQPLAVWEGRRELLDGRSVTLIFCGFSLFYSSRRNTTGAALTN